MITKDTNQAIRIIKEGRITAFPTGTSYGLAVDALQGNALQRLRNIKKRPEEKTFTVMAKEEIWDEYFDMSEDEKELLEKYKNSALTLLVQPKEELKHLAQDGLIGLRITDHPLMEEITNKVDVPLTATSANIVGEEPCYSPQCVEKTFPSKIDETTYDLSLGCILDGGNLKETKPSTIAKMVDGKIQIVRQGDLVIS